MDKQGTIEQMLEAMFVIKKYGVRGVGLEAVYELKEICEKIIALHDSPKPVPGHLPNGDKVQFTLVSDDTEEPT